MININSHQRFGLNKDFSEFNKSCVKIMTFSVNKNKMIDVTKTKLLTMDNVERTLTDLTEGQISYIVVIIYHDYLQCFIS